jgi:hypothetical protein
MESSFTSANIKVLVCSANIGNAEPTPESMAAWLPKDGDIEEVTGQANQGCFTVIVIGMQEASFEVESTPLEAPSYSSSSSTTSLVGEDGKDGKKAKAASKKKGKDSGIITQDLAAISLTVSDDSVSDSSSSKAAATSTTGAMALQQPTKTSSVSSVTSSVSKGLGALLGVGPKSQLPSTKTLQLVGEALSNTVKATDGFVKGVAKVGTSNFNKGYDEVDKAFHKTTKTVRSVAGTQDACQGHPLFRAFTQGEGNECNAERYGGDTACLFNLVKNRLPSYRYVINYLRGQMRLMILVRTAYVNEVSKVECKAENTGIGSVLANKGGIVSTLTIRGTRLCFMSAHLAAHEGEEYYKARNASVEKILKFARVGPQPHYLDASLYNHHSFLCGDLNYRVKLTGNFEEHEDHVNKVFELVDQKDWKSLNGGDELAAGLLKGDCLAGFETPYCGFNPTFKVKREEGFAYNPQRSPRYVRT